MEHLGTIMWTSKRLILRRFEEKDAEELYLGYINQKEFLYYANKERKTLEEEKMSLININNKYKDNNYYNWLITLKDTREIIGSINLRVIENNDSVEFNYAIDNRYTNKGYMTEALEIVKDFCLNKLKIQRFQEGCCIENIASKKVMEKCKMEYEGTLRKYIKLKDGYHDMCIYSIIK